MSDNLCSKQGGGNGIAKFWQMLRNTPEKIWLFDYDLTLYGEEERCVINSLDHRISLFVQKTVGGDFESAHKIRNAAEGALKKAPEKLKLLQGLKGPRFVFTNGRHDWSEAGMAHMGIESAIDGVLDLKQLGWVGKPHDSAYLKMEQWLSEKLPSMGRSVPADSHDIVLLEDSLRNLEPAHRRGWTTVYVNPDSNVPDWVDYHIPHFLDLKIKNE